MRLSTTYNVQAGDTFESVARIVYGLESEAGRIESANPGVLEPLTAGLVLSIPVNPSAPTITPLFLGSGGVDEVAVRIEGTRFRFWSEISLKRGIDTFDEIALSAPFESENTEFRQVFTPFTFKNIDVTVGGELLFTGSVFVVPTLTDGKKVEISAYSLPGVLNDCPLPASVQSEYNGLTLEGLATAVAAPFGIGVVFEADPGAAFDSVATKPTETVLGFLAEMAKQRGLIISSTPAGQLLFLKSSPVGIPAADLKQGESPLLSVAAAFDHQKYYSEVTGIEPTRIGVPASAGGQFTARNPHAAGIVRPFTYTVPDTVGGELKPAVEAKLGRMLGAVAEYKIKVSTWRTPAGDLWEPNTTIRLTAPDVMVYEPYDFILKAVSFDRDSTSERAELTLVMPGAFSGEVPGRLPWGS